MNYQVKLRLAESECLRAAACHWPWVFGITWSHLQMQMCLTASNVHAHHAQATTGDTVTEEKYSRLTVNLQILQKVSLTAREL